MDKLLRLFLLILFYFGFSIAQGIAQEQSERRNRVFVKVGIKENPPYIIKDTDGSYYGISIDLWYKVSNDLGIDYEFVEYSHVQDLIVGLSGRKIDLTINPLPASGTRIRQLDVTQPFLTSNIGISIAKSQESQIIIFLTNIFSLSFLKLFAFLISIVFVFGTIVWYAEKKYNPTDFRDGIYGVMDGIWWSTVTITTVGYGDKTPKTTLGRIISMIWMFAAISLISSFTATITSTLTVNRLEIDIHNRQELKAAGRIGTIANSDTEDYLRRHQIKPSKIYNTPLEGLRALEKGEIRVFVYDKEVIRYLMNEYNMADKIRLLPITFNRHYLSWIMRKRHPLFAYINPMIADQLSNDSWDKLIKKYNME